MRKLTLALLLCTTPLFAAKPKVVPTHPLVTVQVDFSRYIIVPGRAANYQQLDATIDGQQVELYCDTATGVLAPGKYKAQPISTYTTLKDTDGFIPKHPNGFDLFVIYRFILPDGTTRDYYMVGLGPKKPDASAPTAFPAPANP